MLPLYEAKMVDYFDHRLELVIAAQGQRQNQPSLPDSRRTTGSAVDGDLAYWIAEDGRFRTRRNGKTLIFPAYPSVWRTCDGTGVAVRLARCHVADQ